MQLSTSRSTFAESLLVPACFAYFSFWLALQLILRFCLLLLQRLILQALRIESQGAYDVYQCVLAPFFGLIR
ncbi:hypothetical protein ACQ4M3_07875 [Leptolyngbya sp. AN03gr2]|uniref:hypothetical protein n=1 Tax=unclassified Leptolyngbya TaxID=2650499 RepID=UPI003D320F23